MLDHIVQRLLQDAENREGLFRIQHEILFRQLKNAFDFCMLPEFFHVPPPGNRRRDPASSLFLHRAYPPGCGGKSLGEQPQEHGGHGPEGEKRGAISQAPSPKMRNLASTSWAALLRKAPRTPTPTSDILRPRRDRSRIIVIAARADPTREKRNT